MNANPRIGFYGHFTGKMRKRSSGARRTLMASLMLTPMVDMFSLLVIFLLQFFSSSPDFNLTDGVELPTAVTSIEIKEAPVVTVAMEEVFVEREKVGTVDEILKKPGILGERLQQLRRDWLAANPAETFAGEINFEAHTDLESTKVSMFMAILASQHYGSIQLIALGDAT